MYYSYILCIGWQIGPIKMNKLTQKLRKLKVTPVTGKEPETEVEQKWCDTAKITKDKIGYMKPTDIKMK